MSKNNFIEKLKDTKALGLGLALLGLVMVTIGVGRGEASVVLTKAVKICMECIGLG